ncbi:hypothetical protein OCK74_09350 [Chitinophagaceae bacterium LB-8]|uniref:Uncharacterized protein n=1 Tax=Paraflavisolibacter caeni TaxID=2982496 RepID=A0A9X3B7J5_9BACT|nr:hypothetical protein [Paraflavisolibacter caeni]MCU7549320.1 hypothetical protein [Paraflavisolibacter caeni]
MVYPTLNGEPIYPNGFPMHTRRFFIKGESIESIFLRNCKNETTAEEIQWLKDYVIYYIHSPCFQLEELKAKDLKSMSLDDLIWECIGFGVDPF